MCSARSDWPLRQPGFPIRTPPDQSLLGGSPRLIAACNVLHRLLAPRHPPYALRTLALKMLTLAMEFSRCCAQRVAESSSCDPRSEPKKMSVTCPVTDSLPRRARS